MKILLANKFFYIKGGADNSYFITAKLLESKGNKVIFFSMKHNRNFESEYSKYFTDEVDYEGGTFLKKIDAFLKLLYSFEARKKIDELISAEKPDLAHLNSIYHQLSPSIVHSLKNAGIPIVMHLRDYKIVCGSYLMFVKDNICEACKGKRYYNCILKRCFKNSIEKSVLATFEMYLHHSLLHIYDLVDVFISPSKFLIEKVKEMGFKGRIEYLPNFVYPNEFLPSFSWRDRSIVYFGRLSKEKGLLTLLRAVKGLDLTLKIIGEGPEKEGLVRFAKEHSVSNVLFLGYMSGDALKEEVRRSMFTVLPSEWYENNPRAVIEGFALGKPAIGARIGGIPELVIDHETGYTFTMGNVNDLKEKIIFLSSNPGLIKEMGIKSRAIVITDLNEDKYYEGLNRIYSSILK